MLSETNRKGNIILPLTPAAKDFGTTASRSESAFTHQEFSAQGGIEAAHPGVASFDICRASLQIRTPG